MNSLPIKVTLLFTLAVSLVFAGTALTQGHVMQTRAEIQWGEAPPMVPPGAKMAVFSGNPAGDPLYTARVRRAKAIKFSKKKVLNKGVRVER